MANLNIFDSSYSSLQCHMV